MIDSEDLFKAKLELNEFLNNHPHLKSYQNEIDDMLKSSGNSHNRMVLLSMKMKEKIEELKKECEKLI